MSQFDPFAKRMNAEIHKAIYMTVEDEKKIIFVLLLLFHFLTLYIRSHFLTLCIFAYSYVNAGREKDEKSIVLINYSPAHLLETNPVSQSHVRTNNKQTQGRTTKMTHHDPSSLRVDT